MHSISEQFIEECVKHKIPIKYPNIQNNQISKNFNIINNIYVILKLQNFNIFTDFDTFCFLDGQNNNNFNYNIILKSKTIENIIYELLKINNNKIINDNEYDDDPFNINIKINIKYKNNINYDLLYDSLLKESIHNNNNSGLSLTPKQMCNLIILEIQNVNSNMEYEHYIDIDYIKPYELIVKCTFMEFKLILNNKLYPFIPPNIEYISPPIHYELYLSIINLKIIQICNWTSNINLDYLIKHLTKILEPIFYKYIITIDYKSNELMKNLLELMVLTNYNKNIINIDIPKFNTILNNQYWKSGTGYSSSSGNNQWDITEYIDECNLKNTKIIICMQFINSYITNQELNTDNIIILIEIIINLINGLNILELNKNIKLYYEIFIFIDYLYKNNLNDYIKIINNYKNNFNVLSEEIEKFLTIDLNPENTIDLKKQNIELQQILIIISNYLNKTDKIINLDNNTHNCIKIEYCNIMKPLQFNNTYIIPENHSFYSKINHKIESSTMIRLLTEYQSIKNTLPLNWESSIWCFTSNKHYNISTFLISGPKDTPYENGLFEFHVYFPSNYPIKPPNIIFNTTGIPKGSVRFNPNLYNNGKVCLSLLGTWEGYESEKWNPKTSTFLQILISIQSLIFIENPYFNEPGWESNLNTKVGDKKSKQYNDTIYPKTIECAMIDMIKNPIHGFEEIIKNHFKYKKNEILEKLNQLNKDIDLSKLITELETLLE